MDGENPSTLERLATAARYTMVAIFAGAMALLLTQKVPSANAATPVAAAPSYLSFTTKIHKDAHFYITDTNRHVICVYTMLGDQLRLVSARRFDDDSRIVDATLKAPVALEGPGATRDDVINYTKNCTISLDALAKRCGQPKVEE
jgi:hypothetical protein